MTFMKFVDWVAMQETSAFERTRKAAALGLGPDIPAASMHSRNTAPPYQVQLFKKKHKGRKKKVQAVHPDVDSFLNAADELKKDLEKLRQKLDADKKKLPQTKPVKPVDGKKVAPQGKPQKEEQPDKKQPPGKPQKEEAPDDKKTEKS